MHTFLGMCNCDDTPAQFNDRIESFCGINEPPDVVSVVIKLSLVVVGPLDSDRKLNTGEKVLLQYI